MDWDHLRFFAELACGSRMAVAARRMGFEHTRVLRRIQALKKQPDEAPSLLLGKASGQPLPPLCMRGAQAGCGR